MMRCVNPPLVLLHGFTQTRQSWRRTARALAGRYRAIIPDLPGHGQAVHRTAELRRLRGVRPRARPVHARGVLDGRPDRPLHGADDAWHRATRARRREPRHRRSRPSAPSAAPPMTRWRRGSRRMEIEDFAREWGSQPLFAGPERTGRGRRLRGPAAEHAGGARGRAARPGDRRDGAAVGAARRTDDPGDADHRRARREVPRARRSGCSRDYRTRGT